MPVVVDDVLDERTVGALAAKVDRLRAQAPSPKAETAGGPVDEEAEQRRWIDKRRTVEQALAERTGEPRTGLVSLSQQNLWILSRAHLAVSLYNESWQFRMRGPLDRGALDRALEEMVHRHEPLRTRFGMLGAQVVQFVAEPGTFPVTRHHDLTHLPVPEREQAACDLRDALVRTPLDPRRLPLLQVHVLRLAEQEHLVVVHVHHLIFDGVSQEVFLDELAALYQAHHTNSCHRLPELPFQYADFALWQRDHLTGETLQRLLGYWREQLADPPAPLALPTDRPFPPTEDHTGAKVLLTLPGGLRTRVHAFARQENVTPHMVLLTALVVQLHRRSGQSDVCVGTPAGGRLRPGIDALIGCFINSLPLRFTLPGTVTYRQVLQQVRATSLTALEHQELPFDRLVQELRPERHPGRRPYFQVWFATEDETVLPRQSAGVAFTDFGGMTTELSSGTAKADLSWIVIDRGEELLLSMTYRTCLFDPSTIRDMAAEYRTTLEDIVSQPDGSATLTPTPETAGEVPVTGHLLGHWREAFGRQDIGPDDDFFELGGYSLLAMQLVNAVQEDFGVELSFTDFFEASSVSGVAQLLAAEGVTAPSISPAGGAGSSVEDILAAALAD